MADLPFVFPKLSGAGKSAAPRQKADARPDSGSLRLINQIAESRWAWLALALMVLALSAPGLFAMPVLDRDEGRFTEASSEMLETDDYVVIRYHEDLRNKKPVGIHWMQAATVFLTSSAHARDIAAYRLPSLFGAILATWALFWGGTTLFNRRTAFIGAALLGASLLLSSEAHIGKTDAAQCGFLTLAMAALAHMRVETSEGAKKRLAVLFWFAMSVGILLKAVIAPMVAGLCLVCLFIWERKAAWAKPLLYWFGLSLVAVMTIPWFVAVQVATGGEFLFEAARVDLGQKIVKAAEGHKGLPGQHLAALPLLFWPSTLLLIPGVWMAVSRLTLMRRQPPVNRETGASVGPAAKAVAAAWAAEESAAWRFLACWLVPSWLVFELAPTKLFHYTLPLYPVFALMAGAAVDRWLSTGKKMEGRWVSIVLFGLTSAALAIACSPWALAAIRADTAHKYGPLLADRVAYIWSQSWRDTGIGIWPSLLILLSAAGAIYGAVKARPLALLGGVLACALFGGVALRAFVLPNQSWMLPTGAALSALKDVCGFPEGTARLDESGCKDRAPKTLRAIAFAEPSLVFELGGKVMLPPDSKPVLPPVAEDSRPAWLINTFEPEGKAALTKLTAAAAAADRCIRLSRRFVYNYSNGEPHVLVAAVVEPAGCVSEPPPSDMRKTQPSTDDELAK